MLWGGESLCEFSGWPFYEHLFLSVLQYNCLRWLRLIRLFTWLWSTPAEVSAIPTTLIIIVNDWMMPIRLITLAELYTTTDELIYLGYKRLSSIPLPLWKRSNHFCFTALVVSFLLLCIQLFPVRFSIFAASLFFLLFSLLMIPWSPSAALYVCCAIPFFQCLIRQQLTRRHVALFHSTSACFTCWDRVFKQTKYIWKLWKHNNTWLRVYGISLKCSRKGCQAEHLCLQKEIAPKLLICTT